MRYRDFGGVVIWVVGLGTWQLSSADWGKVDEAEALGILQRSVELGVNFLDTADVYGMEHCGYCTKRRLRKLSGGITDE